MNHAHLSRQGARLLCASAALALSAASLMHAQLPDSSRALTRAAMHPVSASLEPAATAAPEALQANTSDIHDDLFAGTEKFAKGASDVTEVNMDPTSLNLVNGPDSHRAHRTVLSVVRTYTYDKPGMYNPADVEEYRRKLTTGDWHCSVHVRDLKSGESTDVCSKRRAPDMIENAIITVEPKSLTFIHNIQKANGQGSHLDRDDDGAFSGADFLPDSAFGSGTGADSARLAASRAQMLASTAALQAELPAMRNRLGLAASQMHIDGEQLRQSMQALQQQLGPKMQDELNRMRDQLKSNNLLPPNSR